MKNRVFNAFLLLAMVGMMFTACKKEYPEPPIQDLPIGTVYTIDEILAMEPGTVFTDDASVVEAFGYNITLVEGNRENIKITTPYDLKIAEVLI